MRSYLTYAQDQNMIDLYLESERIATDNWYTMYRSEQEALSLKGVALHYGCECFARSEGSLQMKRAEDQADQWGRAADEYYNNMATNW